MESVTLTQKRDGKASGSQRLTVTTGDDGAGTATFTGVITRHTRRLRAAHREEGAAALTHGNRGRRPANAMPDSVITRPYTWPAPAAGAPATPIWVSGRVLRSAGPRSGVSSLASGSPVPGGGVHPRTGYVVSGCRGRGCRCNWTEAITGGWRTGAPGSPYCWRPTTPRAVWPGPCSAGRRRPTTTSCCWGSRVPIGAFTDWNEPGPGYLETDLVAHGGGVASGAFIHSLVVTDVCSGWTEAVPLPARERSPVVEGLEAVAHVFPVPVRGMDSDNDSVLIDETLVTYCERQGIEFTRSRAYRKNEQAWIERKNGSVIRRFVGHERYSGAVAGQTLAQGCSYSANTSGPVRVGVAGGPGLAPTGAGRDRCGADGPADPALPGALRQASAADAAARSRPVARCDGEATGVCFVRRRHYQRGRTG